MSGNPYNWQSHSPQIQIPRSGVERAAELLRHNGSAVVMGGRGMGKSVFLGQLKTDLERDERAQVLLVEAPPPTLTVDACLSQLARKLKVPFAAGSDSREIFDAFFARADAPDRLVLLFDEFDRYAEKGASSQPPGRGFFNDLEASRRSLPRLSILATGSIGVFIVRDVLGSSFLARALYLPLRPFLRSTADALVRPFADRHPLSEDVLDALFLASGGIPALLTYGLQELWRLDREVTVDDVTTVYKTFEKDYREYLRDLLSALMDPRLSDAPRRVWERIQEEPGRITRSRLKAAFDSISGSLRLSLDYALYLLEVTGAVRIESEAHDNPIVVRPITSLLDLSRDSEPKGDLRTQLLEDLSWLLARLHRSSADFFRPVRERSAGPSGTPGEGKRLVPESVFAAHLALGFGILGWRAEREAQRGAGRTDLLLRLRRNGDEQTAVVELKIWGRNDYQEAHRQVEGYWTHDVVAAAVVQLTDAELTDWPERYRRECLEPLGARIEEGTMAEGSPIRARYLCVSSTADGLEARVDHFLFRLPRRS